MEEVEIAGDNIVCFARQGAGQHLKVVWVTEEC